MVMARAFLYLPFLNNFKVGKPDMETSATSLAVESILAIEYLKYD